MKASQIEMVCSFCSAKVEYGKSVCDDCKKKYKIGQYDMANDGCGCDG
jgi:predicted amidophosphoribosyltransferase